MEALLEGYDVHSLIGVGGMGAVYRATERRLDREVALKLLPTLGLGEDEMNFAARFRHEATSMAKLNHPAVVQVYEFGEAGSIEEGNACLFLVLEFVEGSDVQQYLQSQAGSIPAEHAHAISCHVLDGLAAAHRRGLIHRDIKPANILLDKEGRVKIADFGLAKETDAEDWSLTKTNLAMGTPDYVAPEALIQGVKVDQRADLFAVGAMLYVMITGQIPRGAFKPASAWVEGLDPRFDTIIRKALQTDPNDRYSNAEHFRRDLDAILTTPLADSGQATSALQIAHDRSPPRLVVGEQAAKAAQGRPVSTSQKKSSSGWILIALGLMAAIAVVGLLVFREGQTSQDAPASETVSSGEAEPIEEPSPGPEPQVNQKGPPARPDPEPTTARSIGPVPEDVIDLLALASPEDWNAWRPSQGGGIQGPEGTQGTRVFLPVEATPPYRIEADIIRTDGARRLMSFVLPLNEGTVIVHLRWSNEVGKFSINGEEIGSQELWANVGDRHKITLDLVANEEGKLELSFGADGKLVLRTGPEDEMPLMAEGGPTKPLFQCLPPSRWNIQSLLLIPGTPQPFPASISEAPVPESETPESKNPLLEIPEYAELRSKYDAAVSANTENIATLAQSYSKALRAKAKNAQESGNLPELNALEAEAVAVEALATDGSEQLPELSVKAPDSLRQLRETWNETYAPLKAKSELHRKSYLKQLDEMVVSLTQAGRIPEANQILAHRNSIGELEESLNLREAQSKGGQLHIRRLDYETGEPADLEPIQSFLKTTDYERVFTIGHLICAFREKGEKGIVLRYNDGRWTHQKELEDIVLDQERLLLFGDGRVTQDASQSHRRWSVVTLPDPISMTRIGVAANTSILVLDRSGEVEVLNYQNRELKLTLPPADWLKGSSKLCSTTLIKGSPFLLVLREDGTTSKWNLRDGVEETTEGYSEGIVDIHGIGSDLMALSGDGRVLKVHGRGELLPPEGSGQIVSMRSCTANTATYQRPDGTWFGVGLSEETVTAIDEIGVALDLVAIETESGGRTIVWITP